MNPTAHRQAAIAVKRAARALRRLNESDEPEDLEEAWDHFLHESSRVYAKLRAAARGHPQSWKWFGKRLDERESDPLLLYTHHARNSDMHRYEEVATTKNPMVMRVGGSGMILHIPTGGATPYWEKVAPDSSLEIENLGVHLVAEAVIDKGKEYPVPTTHLGQEIQSQNADAIAELALSYLEEMVRDAASLIR